MTSKSKRSEISFGHNIEPDKVYWIAFSVYVEDWGRLDRKDAALSAPSCTRATAASG